VKGRTSPTPHLPHRPYIDGDDEFPDRPTSAGLSRPAPDAFEPDGTPIHVVERVLAQRGTKRAPEFLVLWKGYSYTEATWEPLSNMDGAHDAIAEYRALARRTSEGRRRQRRA